MNTFTDLEQAWQQQGNSDKQHPSPEHLVQLAEQKARQLKAKFRWTMGLLLLTFLLLAWYFATYASFRLNTFSVGLMLMMGSMLIRIVLEWSSARQFHQLDVRADFNTYLQLSLIHI